MTHTQTSGKKKTRKETIRKTTRTKRTTPRAAGGEKASARKPTGNKATATRTSKPGTPEVYRYKDPVAMANEAAFISGFEVTKENNLGGLLETQVTGPGGQTTWYVNGPQGVSINLSVSRVSGTGGHYHGAGDAGTVTPAAFTLTGPFPQNVEVRTRAPQACGLIRFSLQASNGTGDEDFVRVMVAGLVPLGSTTGITLVGSTASHPSNHFGTPTLVAKIQELGALFFEKYKKNLFVNDMSLEHGGMFDWQATWTPPHITHRDGRDVDINRSSMSVAQRNFFKRTAEALGFRVEEHGNGKPHWHLHI